MLEWFERKLKSAYLNLLESEVKRLRDENRQLVNSMLASHGMQQIDAPRSAAAVPPIKRANWTSYARKMEAEAARPPAVIKDIPHA